VKIFKIVMCLLLIAATDAVDAEIIKDLDFYESFELLNDESFEIEEQANESETIHE